MKIILIKHNNQAVTMPIALELVNDEYAVEEDMLIIVKEGNFDMYLETDAIRA